MAHAEHNRQEVVSGSVFGLQMSFTGMENVLLVVLSFSNIEDLMVYLQVLQIVGRFCAFAFSTKWISAQLLIRSELLSGDGGFCVAQLFSDQRPSDHPLPLSLPRPMVPETYRNSLVHVDRPLISLVPSGSAVPQDNPFVRGFATKGCCNYQISLVNTNKLLFSSWYCRVQEPKTRLALNSDPIEGKHLFTSTEVSLWTDWAATRWDEWPHLTESAGDW